MGCPVPKIAKHNAGCSLMREPEHAAHVVKAMTRAVKIPVTVKMRAGWDATELNAPDLAKRMEDVGAAAVTVHGRTAAQSYSGFSDWDLIARVAEGLRIPVFGSGDCVEPAQLVDRLRAGSVAGVLVGRGALRNPWIFQQARDLAEGRQPREATAADRARFLLDYIELLVNERVDEAPGFRHVAPGEPPPAPVPARGRQRWVINKLRALNSWYTKGLENGSHLRVAVNTAESIAELRDMIEGFFSASEVGRSG
jgi:nifR3 family TIM-barrel protein